MRKEIDIRYSGGLAKYLVHCFDRRGSRCRVPYCNIAPSHQLRSTVTFLVAMMAFSLFWSSLGGRGPPWMTVVKVPTAGAGDSAPPSHRVISKSGSVCPNCAYGFRLRRAYPWLWGVDRVSFCVLRMSDAPVVPRSLGETWRRNFLSVGMVPQMTRRLHSSWLQGWTWSVRSRLVGQVGIYV